ncbi:unnamed protein product [Caenorhabditis brenneri]
MSLEDPFSGHKFGQAVTIRRRTVPKAADTLDENIEQIRKIARVVNGIYITRGLTNGSIQPDAFISELLRLGPLTLPKIQAMNPY